MIDETLKTLGEKIKKTQEMLKEELASVRAGRANVAIVDKVMVDYYGTPTPLKQLANVATPDPKMITITPFDPSSIKDIERGINEANIGINPNNDGKIIRLTIPPMTEERRKELSKSVKAMGEDAKVALRNLRRTANDELKKAEKDSDISEDEMQMGLDEVQKIIDEGTENIDKIVSDKEEEIMEV